MKKKDDRGIDVPRLVMGQGLVGGVRLTMVDEALLMTTAGAIAGLLLGAIIAFAWVSSIGSLLPNIAFHLPLGLIVGVASPPSCSV